MVCSLGDSLDGIVDAVRHRRIHSHRLRVTLAGLPYARPYHLVARTRRDRPGHRSATYYDEVLFATIARALDDAGLDEDETRDMHLFFGSTAMDVPWFEARHAGSDAAMGNLFVRMSEGYGRIASAIAERFGIEGNCYSFVTACTSSANAILCAASMIEEQWIDRALVVGCDLYNHLGFHGFESLKSLAASRYRPLDRDRDGLILGEACGAVVMAAERRAAGDFQCLGGANLCDTYGVSSHSEDGGAVAETMKRALAGSGVTPGDIRVVKAHGSGTDNNDRCECAALRLVFSGHIPPVTCLKPFIGHTVGACGVNELILFTESVRAGFVPGTPGFRKKDVDLGVAPLTGNMDAGEGVFLLNYCGFGGNCTALVLANTSERP